MMPDQIGQRHVFVIARVVGVDECERRLVVHVLAPASPRLLRLGPPPNRLAAARAALLAAGDPAPTLRQRPLRLAGVGWREEACPIRQRGKRRSTEINPGLLARL